MAIFLSSFRSSVTNFAVTDDFPVPGGPCMASVIPDCFSKNLAKDFGISVPFF